MKKAIEVRTIDLDKPCTFADFCWAFRLTDILVKQLRKKLLEEPEFIDLGRNHGGCLETARAGWIKLKELDLKSMDIDA